MTISQVQVPRTRLIVVALAMVACAAILWLSRGYTFYFDEWDFIQNAPDWGWVSFLQPHNEHPVMLTRLIYAALLSTVGLRSYVPYMLVLLALHAASAVLLFELVRRRAGDLIGVAGAAMLLVLGAGWEDLFWAFQIAFVGSVACGLGMMLALEGLSTPRGASTRRRLAAVSLLTASLMFSGIGLFFGVVAATRLVLTPGRRRELLWFAPVAVAFAAWYLAFGHSGTATVPPPSAANLFVLPAYVAWALAGAVAGIVGVTGLLSLAVLVLGACAVGFAWWHRRPDAFALSTAAGLISFYVVTGLSRAQLGYDQGGSGRYVYVGAVFWLILLADAAGLLPWRGTWRPALAACLFLACFNSSVLLWAYGTAKAELMQREVADLQALAAERSNPCLDPAGFADRLVMPQVNSPARYYRAVDRYGDPAAGRPVTHRTDFDRARGNLTRSDCTPT
ncbi:MAG TPA: hypothetical protein VN940_05150 [Candidatus Dormibacteraeota bacterium]|nr:hypothetical protein [Candidatus Dormibacteraeota bacterium]